MLDGLRKLGFEKGRAEFRSECEAFSRAHYLGFCVIKSLPGCPVGKTILRCYGEQTEKGAVRRFDGTRLYSAHLAGVELSVQGLPFQQQDLGVSACATTALWSALHQFSEFESFGSATPSQITMLASQHSLPYGRAMPQEEGLSVDQMCQAVQALKVAPTLLRADDFETARGYIFSAVASGNAPVLILERTDSREKHAVTVAGMKLEKDARRRTLERGISDLAADVCGLYLHDDRIGPYVSASVHRRGKRLRLHMTLSDRSEDWDVLQILIPTHAKIRLSFAALRRIAMDMVFTLHAYRETQHSAKLSRGAILFDTWISRSHAYIEKLFTSRGVLPEKVRRLCEEVSLPRYLGIVRLSSNYLDPIEILVDTTSTERNTNFCAILTASNKHPDTHRAASFLANEYDCHSII
ncbi:MAG: hypothetical protein QOF89_4413 [Acidobacteriota bacterium]|jgi:hypothetical protein|nr:hypothetical protein [Acidobacteriota bacterium]